jgi:flagellar motor switch protein FliM
MDLEPKVDSEGKKVLSQWEIDSLLGAFGSEETVESGPPPAPEKNVRPYDFRRPDKFSKEHLRVLQTIHETFSRNAANSLSSYLRTNIQVRLSSIEQAVYGEYIQQLVNPTIINIVSAHPLPGRMIMEVNLSLAFGIIDRLLGGTGQIVERLREVTDIEMTLIQTLIKTLLASLRDAWTQMTNVSMRLDDMVFNPQIVQAALHADIGVLFLFEVRLGEGTSTISMFVPYTLLEPIMGKLTSQMWFATAKQDSASDSEQIRHQLEKVELPVTVDLGTANVTVRELMGLQKGNVVRLDTSVDHELRMMVGGKHKVWGRPGRIGRRLGLEVTRVPLDECAPLVTAASTALGRESE